MPEAKVTEVTILSSYPNTQPTRVFTREEMVGILRDISGGQPGVVILTSPYKGALTCGLSKSLGFAQYSNADRTPPYLIAIREEREEVDETDLIEFDSGGTPTQIPRSLCIPIEDVFIIAAVTFFDEETPADIIWIEV